MGPQLFLVNGEPHEFSAVNAEVRSDGDLLWVKGPSGWKSAVVVKKGNLTLISYLGRQYELQPATKKSVTSETASAARIVAPMPGLIVSIAVQAGDMVKKGQTLMTIEAMKTQLPIIAPGPGIIEEIAVKMAQQVKSQELLAIFK